MSIRDILIFPRGKEELRRTSQHVPGLTPEVQKLITDLKDTLLAHPEGIGLAAPQINVHQRVVVVRLAAGAGENEEPEPPLALINPRILEENDRRLDFDGCLSFPGLYGETVRPHYLHVTGLDEKGKTFHRVFEGFDAVLVHHEIDHLDGVLFIDRARTLEDLYRFGETKEGQTTRFPLPAEERILLEEHREKRILLPST